MQQELARLSSQLETSCTISDVRHVRSVMRKVHTFVTRGHDLSPIASKILKFLSYQDVVVKKAVFLFIMRSCHKSEVGLLALNALLKDTRDPNPLYRALAINTLACVPSISERGIPQMLPALDDPSAHVRRSAICCCLELWRRHPAIVDELDLVDKLYAAIRDRDPIVVGLCLRTLDDILKSEGGIVINKKIAHYLLKQLDAFQQWGIIFVLNFLRKYKPQSEEEVLLFVNSIDKYLTANSISVQLSAFELFRSVVSGSLDHLLRDGLEQVWSKLRIQLAFHEEEMVKNILTWVEPFAKDYADIFLPHRRQFYCRFSDSASTKCKRMGILRNLANEETAAEIVEELLGYCMDVDEVCKCALRALVEIANEFPLVNDRVVQHLMLLLEVPEESLLSEVLSAICRLTVVGESDLREQILESVVKRNWNFVSPSAKCAVLSTIAEYGRDFEPSPYILEEYVENLTDDEDVIVKETLLSVAVRLFFARPAEMQDILGVLLDVLCRDSSPFVQQHAMMYYNMLSADVEVAERIFTKS